MRRFIDYPIDQQRFQAPSPVERYDACLPDRGRSSRSTLVGIVAREVGTSPRLWFVISPEYLKTDCATMMEYGLETPSMPGSSLTGCGE